MNQAVKQTKSIESGTCAETEASLKQAIEPITSLSLVTIEKFDASKHSAKKYKVTFTNGGSEIANDYDDLLDIIEQCLSQSEVYNWAAEGFERSPSDEEIRDFINDNAVMCLTDFGCKVETFLGGSND